MGNTAAFTLPYPDPTGKVTAGATNMRQLAERVDAVLAHAYATAGPDGALTLGASGSGYLPWALLGGTGQFTDEADPHLIRYAGPNRWAMVSAGAVFTAQNGGNPITSLAFTAQLRGSGQPLAASSHSFAGGAGVTAYQHTLAIAEPVYLTNGYPLQLEVSTGAGAGAQVGGQWLRIAAMGASA